MAFLTPPPFIQSYFIVGNLKHFAARDNSSNAFQWSSPMRSSIISDTETHFRSKYERQEQNKTWILSILGSESVSIYFLFSSGVSIHRRKVNSSRDSDSKTLRKAAQKRSREGEKHLKMSDYRKAFGQVNKRFEVINEIYY